MTPATRYRLDSAIKAVCPIDGTSGEQGSVRIDYSAVATQQQRAAADAALASFDWSANAQAAFDLTQGRADAASIFNATTAQAKANKAIVQLVVDELNLLRQRDTDLRAQIAAASTLADLKTRVSSMTALSARTLSQALTAIQAAIGSGKAD